MRKSVFTLLFLGLFTVSAYATQYTVLKDQSQIKASIRYTVIGRYKAQFKNYDSFLVFDPNDLDNSSVRMVFETKSIHSGMARFDRIVRSSRLLDARQYPQIIFQSHAIKEKGDAYFVSGTLDLHGIQREHTFKFKVEELKNNRLKARGKWKIPRKAFGVIWHKVFDHGGIIVGNTITIDWELTASSF